MSLGQHECSIILCDENVGEMEYKIEAKADLPIPIRIPQYERNIENT